MSDIPKATLLVTIGEHKHIVDLDRDDLVGLVYAIAIPHALVHNAFDMMPSVLNAYVDHHSEHSGCVRFQKLMSALMPVMVHEDLVRK